MHQLAFYTCGLAWLLVLTVTVHLWLGVIVHTSTCTAIKRLLLTHSFVMLSPRHMNLQAA